MAKQTKGQIIVDIIRKISQHSFFELFGWKTRKTNIDTIQLCDRTGRGVNYNVTTQEINVIILYFSDFYLLHQVPTV